MEVVYDGSTNPSLLSYTIPNLESQLTYIIQVRALNKAGQGALSTATSCFTATTPGQPGTPKLVSSSSSQITVSWSPAYDDGGSPIKEYQLEMDEVEGLGAANIESWATIYQGSSLTYSKASGLTATKSYRFRVRAVSEQDIESQYSEVNEFIAASLPAQITFSGTPFMLEQKTLIKFQWVQPTIAASDIAVTKYNIYWNEGFRSSGEFVLYDSVNAFDQTFYTAENLVTGTTYSFQVTAVNEIGEGTLSAEITSIAKDLPGKPEAPWRTTSVKTSATEASITLQWNPLINTGGVALTGYKLYQKHVLTSATTLAYDGTDAPEITTITITNLVLDNDYEFYVTGLNPEEGSQSDSITLRAAALPNEPTAITETASTRTGSSIGLEWVAPSDDGGSAITAYTLVEVNENKDDQVKYYGTNVNAILKELRAGSEYNYKVKASNIVGDGPYSNIFTFLIVEKPSSPLNLQIDSFDNTFVTVSWEMPISNGGQPISGFKLYRQDCNDVGTDPVLITTQTASTFQYTDNSVTGGVEYRYFITAYNVLGGEGSQSNEALVTPITVPSGLSAPTHLQTTMNSLTVTWVAPTSDGDSPVEKYALFIKAEYESMYREIYRGLTNQYKATLLPTGFYYQFKVKAINKLGESSFSSASVSMITAIEPQTPINLDLVSRSSTAIKFSWNKPLVTGGVNLSGYKVYKAEGSGSYAEITTAPAKTNPVITTHEESGLTAGQTYKFKVSSYN